jgi:hypothetical protein
MNHLSVTDRPWRRRRSALITAALPLLAGVAAAAAAPPVSARPAAAAVAQREKDVERAELSQLAMVRLPGAARRSTSKRDVAKFEDALQSIARTNHGRMARVEVLVWRGGEAWAAMKELPERLKDAGYGYAARPAFDAEPGRVTPFGAVRADKKDDLLGLWIETKDGVALLAWGVYLPDNPSNPGHPAGESAAAPPAPAETSTPAAAPLPAADPAAVPASRPEPVNTQTGGAGAAVPSDLIGSWSWTTIGGVNYRDTNTGQLKEPSGMSARFTFTPDGRYTYFWYARQRTFSLVTEATSTHEGKVVFAGDGGTFTLHPAKGHYKGNTGSRLIDRPMTAEERKPMTFRWEWRTENGKRQLYIGPGKNSLSPFKPAEGSAPAAAPVTAKPPAAATGGQKPAATRPAAAGKSSSTADKQAEAFKKLNDYNYVKQFGPISGPLYRSSKW